MSPLQAGPQAPSRIGGGRPIPPLGPGDASLPLDVLDQPCYPKKAPGADEFDGRRRRPSYRTPVEAERLLCITMTSRPTTARRATRTYRPGRRGRIARQWFQDGVAQITGSAVTVDLSSSTLGTQFDAAVKEGATIESLILHVTVINENLNAGATHNFGIIVYDASTVPVPWIQSPDDPWMYTYRGFLEERGGDFTGWSTETVHVRTAVKRRWRSVTDYLAFVASAGNEVTYELAWRLLMRSS